MDFKEFSEFPNLDEEDFDINSSFSSNNEEENSILEEDNLEDAYNQETIKDTEEWFLEEDIFEDENIEETLRKYNYDYKTLMMELTTFTDYSELMEILNVCGIKKEEYLNPTYDVFEKIRDYIINNNKNKAK